MTDSGARRSAAGARFWLAACAPGAEVQGRGGLGERAARAAWGGGLEPADGAGTCGVDARGWTRPAGRGGWTCGRAGVRAWLACCYPHRQSRAPPSFVQGACSAPDVYLFFFFFF